VQSRFLKQLIYGTFYLAILFGIGYLIYTGALRGPASCFDNRQNQGETGIDCGGPCLDCGLKNLEPIRVSPVSIFDIGGRLSVLFELRNPNVRFGANEFAYTIEFYGPSNTLVSSLTRNSFIYPGEIKYIVEAGLEIDPSGVRRAEVELANFSWKSREEFSLPRTQVRDLKTEIDREGNKAEISGVIVNQNSFRLSRVVVSAIIFNSAGARIGVSKTLAEDTAPFEEKTFTIVALGFDIEDVDTDATRIYLETRR